MAPWFEPFDDAVGGVADNVEGAIDWTIGGAGSFIGDTIESGADTGSSVIESALAPLTGLGTWILLLAGILAFAVIASA